MGLYEGSMPRYGYVPIVPCSTVRGQVPIFQCLDLRQGRSFLDLYYLVPTHLGNGRLTIILKSPFNLKYTAVYNIDLTLVYF